jgi:glycolate oxidase iron-sulfur subunit
MKTNFALTELSDPDHAEAEKIIKQCIHCGCCNSTCPTFDLLGDELDSPRGRIYLMKDMLENGRVPDGEIVTHIDRCLSCLRCLTSCPSNVDYMHLIDHARAHIEENYRRPWHDRLLRGILARVLPYPDRFRVATMLARPFKPLATMLRAIPGMKPYGAMLDLAPKASPRRDVRAGAANIRAATPKTKQVIVPSGCVQQVLAPEIDRSAIRVLNAIGVEVVVPPDDNCCGALVHHLGRNEQSHAYARRNVDVWTALMETGQIDAIVITTSGCGTTIKDYGHMLAHDPDYAARAARVSAIAKDITEFLAEMDLPDPAVKPGLKVAYQSACSMQHGQKIMNQPRKLLLKAGFKIVRPKDEHMCCGSAGTYSILQSDISRQLRDKKVANLEETGADIIAGGNIGCLTQINSSSKIKAVHTVILLDWALTGEKPVLLERTELPHIFR